VAEFVHAFDAFFALILKSVKSVLEFAPAVLFRQLSDGLRGSFR